MLFVVCMCVCICACMFMNMLCMRVGRVQLSISDVIPHVLKPWFSHWTWSL